MGSPVRQSFRHRTWHVLEFPRSLRRSKPSCTMAGSCRVACPPLRNCPISSSQTSDSISAAKRRSCARVSGSMDIGGRFFAYREGRSAHGLWRDGRCDVESERDVVVEVVIEGGIESRRRGRNALPGLKWVASQGIDLLPLTTQLMA